MLNIEDLWVSVDGKGILNGVNLHIPVGETHVLFGKTGSGKSTLLMTIMGFPRYAEPGGAYSKPGQVLRGPPYGGGAPPRTISVLQQPVYPPPPFGRTHSSCSKPPPGPSYAF